VRIPWAGLIGREDDGDELVQEAIDALEDLQMCSTSMLQRKLRIGYPRAARLMEQLEEKCGYPRAARLMEQLEEKGIW